jgi:hypothetical protein
VRTQILAFVTVAFSVGCNCGGSTVIHHNGTGGGGASTGGGGSNGHGAIV